MFAFGCRPTSLADGFAATLTAHSIVEITRLGTIAAEECTTLTSITAFIAYRLMALTTVSHESLLIAPADGYLPFRLFQLLSCCLLQLATQRNQSFKLLYIRPSAGNYGVGPRIEKILRCDASKGCGRFSLCHIYCLDIWTFCTTVLFKLIGSLIDTVVLISVILSLFFMLLSVGGKLFNPTNLPSGVV